jgi:3-oxoacyl-[acyl-carrier protein] reductase
MLMKRSGAIVNISSIIGLRGYAGLSAYSATKAALDGVTRALARELGPGNIRVNSVAPGYLQTDMVATITDPQREQILRRTPLGRLGTVEDVVGVVRFLLSEEARYVTGAVWVVDGGVSC